MKKDSTELTLNFTSPQSLQGFLATGSSLSDGEGCCSSEGAAQLCSVVLHVQVHRQFSALFGTLVLARGKEGQKARGCLIAMAMMSKMDVGNQV